MGPFTFKILTGEISNKKGNGNPIPPGRNDNHH